MRDFRVLVDRIERLTGNRLVKKGYFPADRLRRYYGSGARKLKFQYFAVRANEGYGVLHVLYVGDWLPQKWLSDTWLGIHGAWDVDIRKTHGKSKKGIAGYLMQYVSGQHKFVRYSWSKGWVWPGFVRQWEYLKRQYRNARLGLGVWNGVRCEEATIGKALDVWKWHLAVGVPVDMTKSSTELALEARDTEFLLRHKKMRLKRQWI
jgi:hypothetical protein